MIGIEAFGIPPPMRSFFEKPTVGHLAVGVLSELADDLEALGPTWIKPALLINTSISPHRS